MSDKLENELDQFECGYCDGELIGPMDGYDHVYQCSNLADCPATFVAVIGR